MSDHEVDGAGGHEGQGPNGSTRPWRWPLWIALLAVPAVVIAAVALLAFFVVSSSPPLPEDIADHASVVRDADGDEVGGLAADVSRSDVALGSLPVHVPQAVMGIEDRRFYEHRGVSVTGIARALFTNVRAGAIEQGGSTITQQYIKNAALQPEQTYRRKVEEVALAMRLEQAYTKDEILHFYLNTAYWGRGATGIEAAANAYFDKSATELTANESATLAAMLAAPESLDPSENPDRVDARRRASLTGMLERGWIDQTEHDDLVADGLPTVTQRAGIDLGPNGYYLDAVRRVLASHPDLDDGQLFRGLRIQTPLDQRLQADAQEVLTAAIVDGPTDTGAIVTVDPTTGGIRALVSGPDAMDQPLNTAMVSNRQVGSAFKPFTLQAFVEDGYSPQSRFDGPASIEIGGHDFTNFAGAGFGSQTVEQATVSSINTVYLQMQEHVGRDKVIDAANRVGLPRDKSEERFATQRGDGRILEDFAGLTLGQNDFTTLEMAAAFGTYAAEGQWIAPHLITRIEDRAGNVLWEADPTPQETVDANVARVVTDVLRRVIEAGTGSAADIGRPAAGKTGTTDEGRNVWFVGYVPQLSTGVWLGNSDNSPIESDGDEPTGGGLAAPIWAEYMARAVDGLDVVDFTAPDLSGLEALNESPQECPDGYRFADPPESNGEEGGEEDRESFEPDVVTGITDDEGRPCVEVEPDSTSEEESGEEGNGEQERDEEEPDEQERDEEEPDEQDEQEPGNRGEGSSNGREEEEEED